MIYDPGAEAALRALAAVGRWTTFHTASPGPDGENAVGRRMATQWAEPRGRSMAMLMPVECWLEPCTVTHYGVWTLESGGRFVADGELDDPIEVTVAGMVRLRVANILIPGGTA